MIDSDLLRAQSERVKQSIEQRGGDRKIVDRFLKLDASWRAQLRMVEQLRSKRRSRGKGEEMARQHQEELKNLKEERQRAEAELAKLDRQRNEILRQIPNLIDPNVPAGPGETANRVIKQVGSPKIASGKSHEELMTKLDWLDLETAALTSGSRFRYLKNQAAIAHLRLVLEAFSFAVKKGFRPVIPPIIAKEQTFEKGGFFPFGKEETFQVSSDLFLSGTSELMLVALFQNRRFKLDDLPIRVVGFSSCFRREAGSYGKDTRGMFRQHQFDKVELVVICSKEQSPAEHENLIRMQEELVSRFNLPYQLVLVGSGDLSPKEAKKIDLETWLPGQGKYRETHSASNCTDFQTRRLGIKVNRDGKDEYAHALNATLATERLLLAIIENNQRSDGSVALPESLTLS